MLKINHYKEVLEKAKDQQNENLMNKIDFDHNQKYIQKDKKKIRKIIGNRYAIKQMKVEHEKLMTSLLQDFQIDQEDSSSQFNEFNLYF